MASGLTIGETEFDGIEEQHMRTVIVAPDAFDELVASGELTDAKTLLAVHMMRSRSAG